MIFNMNENEIHNVEETEQTKYKIQDNLEKKPFISTKCSEFHSFNSIFKKSSYKCNNNSSDSINSTSTIDTLNGGLNNMILENKEDYQNLYEQEDLHMPQIEINKEKEVKYENYFNYNKLINSLIPECIDKLEELTTCNNETLFKSNLNCNKVSCNNYDKNTDQENYIKSTKNNNRQGARGLTINKDKIKKHDEEKINDFKEENLQEDIKNNKFLENKQNIAAEEIKQNIKDEEDSINSSTIDDEMNINNTNLDTDITTQIQSLTQDSTQNYNNILTAYKSKLKLKKMKSYIKNSRINEIKNQFKIFHKCNFPGCTRTFSSSGWLKTHLSDHISLVQDDEFNKDFNLMVSTTKFIKFMVNFTTNKTEK
jgi:hypothetical protein